jgi:hypothetical protein
MQLLIQTIQSFFEINEKCGKHEWLSYSFNMKDESIQKLFKNTFEFKRLIELIDENHATKSLNELAVHLLDLYGVHINGTGSKSFTWKHSITILATNILSDLFENCQYYRECIVRHLLTSIESCVNDEKIDLNHSIFFDQLEILFNNYKRNFDFENEKDKLEPFMLKYFHKSLLNLNSLCTVKLLNIFDFYLKLNNNNVKNLVELFKKSLDSE